jgi:hypothetical protein
MSADVFRVYTRITEHREANFRIVVESESDSFEMGPDGDIAVLIRNAVIDTDYLFGDRRLIAISNRISQQPRIVSVKIVNDKGNGAIHYPNRRTI